MTKASTIAVDSPGPAAPGTTPPNGDLQPATETMKAFLSSEGSSSIAVDQLEVSASAATKEALDRAGCGAFVKAGDGGLRFRARASYPAALVDWTRKQMTNAEAGASARIAISVANDKKQVKCRIAIEASSLEHLALNGAGGATAPIDDVHLVWTLKGGVSVASGDVTGDGHGAAMEEGSNDVLANDEEPVTAALIVPAVQKIREARIHGAGVRLFDKGSVLPPPFEVDVDEAAFADLFDGSAADEIELGIVTLGRPATASHGSGAGAGKVSVHDISFTARLKKEAVGAQRTTVKVVPISGFGVVIPATDAQLAAARGKATILADELGPTLDLDAVARLVSALADQPSGSGAPSSRRDELLSYWRGDPAKGTAGAATSFDNGLASFLKSASDVEGVWAYERLPIAASIFSKIESAHGRALSGVSLLALPEAAFPLRPGRLRTIGEAGGHDYRFARATVAQMAALTDVIASGGPGGQPLASIDPDEIDVANAAKAEASPSVSSVDAAARSFVLAREALLDAPAVSDAALLDLQAKSASLAKAIDELKTVTKARFAATN